MAAAAYLAAQLAAWPDMQSMARILRSGGLVVTVGRYSIRIHDFAHFSFEHYGGDLCEPSIDADADDAEALAAQAKRVSSILAKAGLVHRFEVYEDDNEEMTHYFHYGWPNSTRA
jgi:hypothetical protein